MITCSMSSMSLATQGANVMGKPPDQSHWRTGNLRHRQLGELTPPMQFDGKATSQALPSPMLGEHSRSILRQFSWSDAIIEDLENRHIVQCV